MKTIVKTTCVLIFAMGLHETTALLQPTVTTRRQAVDSVLSGLISGSAALTTIIGGPQDMAFAADDLVVFENRDRNGNRNALIREDYWFMTGKTPPRLLTKPLQGDDPQWNAFGSCKTTQDTVSNGSGGTVDGGNPCTYVSLKQRAPAYSKYASTIIQGAKEYQRLGQILQQQQQQPSTTTATTSPAWDEALTLIRADLGAAAIDAELKMILLATALLVSPNFPTPNKELLVARYYANEVHYAQGKLRVAIEEHNREEALAAWELGKDSWNSYFQVVNRSISPKVGDKFQLVV